MAGPETLQYVRDYEAFFGSGGRGASFAKPKRHPLPKRLLRLINILIVGTSFTVTMTIISVLSYFILSCYGVF